MRRGGTKKWLRRLAIGFAAALAGLLATSGAGYLYLTSKAGEARLRRTLLEQADEPIAGRLSIGKLDVRGSQLAVRDLLLTDPEGRLVASAARAHGRISLGALLRRRIHLTMTVEQPDLRLEWKAGELNLSRALAREAKGPPGRRSELAIDFRIVGGTFTLQLAEDRPWPSTFRLAALQSAGSVRQGSTGQLVLRAQVRGEALSPLAGPISAAVQLEKSRSETRGRLDLAAPGLQLGLDAGRSGDDAWNLRLRRLVLAPPAAKTLVPPYPLVTSLSLVGEASHRAGLLSFELNASAGSARSKLRGAASPTQRRVRTLEASFEHLDLRELLGRGPPTDLWLHAVAQGAGARSGDLTGQLQVRLESSTIAGRTVGPAYTAIQATKGKLAASLRAQLPGARLSATGRGQLDRLELQGMTDIEDLALLSEWIGQLTQRPLPVRGSGRLRFRAEGPPASPSLNVEGQLSRLAWETIEATGATVVLSLPDPRRPLEGAAAAVLANELTISGRHFREVSLQAGLGPEGSFAASAKVGPLALEAAGRRLQNAALEISALELELQGSRWRLQGTAGVELGRGRFRLAGLRLASGPQSLLAEALLEGEQLEARLVARRFQLANLPTQLTGLAWPLSGDLSAALELKGRRARPDATVDLVLRDGAAGELRHLTLAVHGQYREGRAAGSLTARALGARASARFDLSENGRPISVAASITRVDLARLITPLGGRPLQGMVSATIEVAGTAAAPSFRLSAQGKELRLRATSFPLQAWLTARGDAQGTRIDLKLDALEGSAQLALRAPLASPEILRVLSQPERLLRLPLVAEGSARRLDLAALRTELKARLDATLHLEGSLENPSLTLRTDWSGLALGSAPLGSGELGLRYAAGQLSGMARLETRDRGRLELEGEAAVDLSLPGLKRGIEIRRVPVRARLGATRFDLGALTRFFPWTERLSGALGASASLKGTLAEPNLEGKLDLPDGRVELRGYGSYRLRLAVVAEGDRLSIERLEARSGDGHLRLGAQARRVGEKWSLQGSANAERFPITVDHLRRGELTSSARFSGELTPGLLELSELSLSRTRFDLADQRPGKVQPLERPEGILLVEEESALLGQPGPEAPPAPSAPRPKRWKLKVVMRTADGVTVAGRDAFLKLLVPRRLRLDLQEKPLLFGEVRVAEGWVEISGRRFDLLEDSRLEFRGPPSTPFLNLTAQEARLDQVAVFLEVRGSGEELAVSSSGDQSLSELDIYGRLARGQPSPGGQVTGAGQAATFVGSFAGSFLRRLIGARLPIPLDVVAVEAGQAGLPAASVQVGTYLGDRLFLGYASRPAADPRRGENQSAVRIEYRLGRRWAFQAEYGNANAGGADLLWVRRF